MNLTYRFIVVSALVLLSVSTYAEDSYLKVLPDVRKRMAREVPEGNPFRRTISQVGSAEEKGQSLEDKIRAVVGGKNIGGVVFGSRQAEPQIVIREMVFGRNDELLVPDDEGTLKPMVPDYHIRVQDIMERALILEVSVPPAEKGIPMAQTVEVPFDDYFRFPPTPTQ